MLSSNEVMHVICNNLRNSSSGPEGIHPVILKNLSPRAIVYLTCLFNVLFSTGSYPKQWKTAIVILILKPKADPSASHSYRLISLIIILGKVLEKNHQSTTNIIPWIKQHTIELPIWFQEKSLNPPSLRSGVKNSHRFFTASFFNTIFSISKKYMIVYFLFFSVSTSSIIF